MKDKCITRFLGDIKPIKNYERYYVSKLGHVFTIGRTSQLKEIAPCKTPKGYLKVWLYKNGKRKMFYIHRLVAQAFLENPEALPMVNHKDEDKSNNTVENLEWCDVQYNTHYGTRVQRIASKNLNDPSRSKEVAMYDKTGVFLKKYPSLCEARRDTNISDRLISSCCRGYRKSAKGYIFAYANEGLVKQQKRYRCFLDKLKAKKNKGRNV